MPHKRSRKKSLKKNLPRNKRRPRLRPKKRQPRKPKSRNPKSGNGSAKNPRRQRNNSAGRFASQGGSAAPPGDAKQVRLRRLPLTSSSPRDESVRRRKRTPPRTRSTISGQSELLSQFPRTTVT